MTDEACEKGREYLLLAMFTMAYRYCQCDFIAVYLADSLPLIHNPHTSHDTIHR